MRGLRILYLENDHRYVEMVAARLTREKVAKQVCRVTSYDELASVLAAQGADLVLADYRLLSREAGRFLTLVRKSSSFLPFILVGGIEEESAIELLEVGFTDYVPKENPARLVNSIIRARREAWDAERLRRARLQELRLETLNELSMKVLAHSTLKGVLREITDAARVLTASRFAAAGCDVTDGSFTVVGFSGEEPPEGGSLLELAGVALLARAAQADTFLVRHDDLKKGAQWEVLAGCRPEVRGFVVARLTEGDGGATGIVIAVDKVSGGDFRAEDEALLRQLAGITSLGIKHIKAAEEIRELNRNLERQNAELEAAHHELGKRVTERTVELAETVEVLLEEITERNRAEKALQAETAERIRAMEALREKDRMLIQQSRQAAMGEMIGNIAHQWRQPLNVLALLIQSLSMEQELGELTLEYLKSVEAKGMKIIQHMSQTINDFRNYFKPDKEKVPFKVSSAIIKTVSLLEDSFKYHDIRIKVDAPEDPVIQGYPNEYAQVLLNILNNARDAFLQNPVKYARQVQIVSRAENGRAVVTVADNAGGIPDTIMEKIFDPYFTTKGPDKGTGVGLFMSKSIIEKNMGGSLTVRNAKGGAEFRIEV